LQAANDGLKHPFGTTQQQDKRTAAAPDKKPADMGKSFI
jgi:hypothetical protein